MKPIRPSSAIQRSQTFRLPDEKLQPNIFHQGLLNLAKPVILLRPQTAKLQQIKPNSRTSHPCLTDTKALLSEKEINEKLHECLKADVYFKFLLNFSFHKLFK